MPGGLLIYKLISFNTFHLFEYRRLRVVSFSFVVYFLKDICITENKT